MQKRNKKGFTLAELLIVVAIIAVLVAIAVPLFVAALDDAEKKVIDANEHSVKSMAVTAILTDTKYSAHISEISTWICNATVDENGTITLNDLGASADTGCKHTTKVTTATALDGGSKKNEDGTFSITVEIAKSDLTVTPLDTD